MDTIVVQNITRTPRDIVEELGKLGTATVHEAQGRIGLMSSRMAPIQQGVRLAGTAVTVSTATCDNWMLHVAVEQMQEGDIMVVEPFAPSDAAYFGDLLGTSCMAWGCKALVINAATRDAMELREMGFPVWSTTPHNAQGTVKETVGSVNTPIVCAGAYVEPGDVIVADDDGVCVVRRADAAAVLVKAREREAQEAATRARMAKKELGLDIYNMREKLAAKGLKYV